MNPENSIYSQKIAGLLVPLFALRGKNDLGIGDTAALTEMIFWAAKHGFRAVQILPINETSGNNSPYDLLSAMALEPSTITTHPSWLPDLRAEEYDGILSHYDLNVLKEGAVQYSLIKKCKQELLTTAWKNFQKKLPEESRVRDFQLFQEEEAFWLLDYTLYRALLEKNEGREDFLITNPTLRDAASALQWLATRPAEERRDLEERRSFFSYVQWIAITQWKKVFATAESLKMLLIGDVPCGVHASGADVFSKPELFDTKKFGGAPPEKIFQADPFTKKWGQNWGVPLYRWEEMAHDNFQWWRRRLRLLRSFFHILRIDHALGLFRIYSFPWPPERDEEFLALSEKEAQEKTGGLLPGFVDYADDTPEHITHNKNRGAILLRIFQEEAGEEALIAEDLGIVPFYVPPVLEELKIPGFKIPFWIRHQDNTIISPKEYPLISIATYATHDHPPLREQWETWQRAISTKSAEATVAEKSLKELLSFIDSPELGLLEPFEGKIHHAFLNTLYESHSWLTVLMITDFFGLTQTFNKPGKSAHSNWTERMSLPIAAWDKNHSVTLTFSDNALKTHERFHAKISLNR